VARPFVASLTFLSERKRRRSPLNCGLEIIARLSQDVHQGSDRREL